MTNIFDRRVRPLFAYGTAVILIGTTVLAFQPWPLHGSITLPLLVLLIAVLGTGMLGGPGPVILAAALGVLAADILLMAPAWQPKVPGASDITAILIFAAGSALVAWMAAARHRAATAAAHSGTIAADLALEVRRRRTQSDVTARALAAGSVEAVCRDAAALTAAALDCEHCLVLELGADTRPFVIAGASGWDAHVVEGLTIDTGIDTQAGYAVYAREPIAVGDADAEGRFTIPAVLRARGIRSGLAARIGTAVRAFGVIAVYSTSARRFSEADGEFLLSVATALAGLYERRRLETERADLASRDAAQRATADLASRRAAFLAQTATVLDSALEPEATLVSLARLAVPGLADCAIVDLVHDDGHVLRIDVVDIDPTRRDATQAIRRIPPNLHGVGPFARAIRTGQPVLLTDVADKPRDAERTTDDEHERLIRAAQCESLLLMPLVARGQTLGLLTLGTRTPNRYGAADLLLAQELGARAAIALDNARLYREVQAASRAKDEFLATVSHELRTPLNAVLGWTAMLRNRQLEPSRAEFACEAIERSARAQVQLLEQLLDVSRIVSGKLELRLAPVHLEDVAETAIDTVRPTAEARNVRIGARIDRSLPLLMADSERLQQVLVNLLSNAVKFSPDDGLVQVEVRRMDSFVQIIVSDQGVGIRGELLPYVFDRLRQGTAPGGMDRGLGLGLWIVRDLVERHGGKVTAASPGEGKGATFTVTLPLWSQAEPVGEPVRTVASRADHP